VLLRGVSRTIFVRLMLGKRALASRRASQLSRSAAAIMPIFLYNYASVRMELSALARTDVCILLTKGASQCTVVCMMAPRPRWLRPSRRIPAQSIVQLATPPVPVSMLIPPSTRLSVHHPCLHTTASCGRISLLPALMRSSWTCGLSCRRAVSQEPGTSHRPWGRAISPPGCPRTALCTAAIRWPWPPISDTSGRCLTPTRMCGRAGSR
jgi:hypothetical protein